MVRIERIVGMRAMPVLATALLEKVGVSDMIDEQVAPDPQRILTPGMATKLMVGSMFLGMGRRPLYKMDRDYSTAPLDILCGPGIEAKNLNGRAFSRALDDLFELDLTDLIFRIHERFCEHYGLRACVYNMDSTNFGVTAVVVERDDDRAAIPEWNGHAKDGDNSKRVYNLQTVTDGNGCVCYERPYDGSVSDSEMDLDTVRYLAENVDASASTLVADAKLVTRDLIEEICGLGFGFVSKCPDNFGKKAREKIVYSVVNSDMIPSSYAPGWCVYDTDMTVDGRELRFVAFRSPEGVERSKDYLRKQGLKNVERKLKPLMNKAFACEKDAMLAYEEAVRELSDTAYRFSGSVYPSRVVEKYGRRGRPPAGWTPRVTTAYHLDIDWEYSEELADEMSSDRQIRVLVTNLPRSEKDATGNPRDGASADDVLRLYLGQYRVEHAFRTAKSEFQVDTVYFHKPSRANAFMFVVSLATMTAGIIRTVMRKNEMLRTAEGMIDDLTNLTVRMDPGDPEVVLVGDEISAEEFLTYLRILGIDEDSPFA